MNKSEHKWRKRWQGPNKKGKIQKYTQTKTRRKISVDVTGYITGTNVQKKDKLV